MLTGPDDTSIWDDSECVLVEDAYDENDGSGKLRFSSVYGDDITNF